MALWQITSPEGQILEIEGDVEPTQDEITQLFEQHTPVVRDVAPGSLTPPDLLPAIRTIGGKIETGEPGDTHPDIIKRQEIPAVDIDQRGFTGPSGEFYDRETAAKGLQVPTEFEPGRLHSTDLINAQEQPRFEAPLEITEKGPVYASQLEQDKLAREWGQVKPPPIPEVSSLAPVTAGAVTAVTPEGKRLLPGTQIPQAPVIEPEEPKYLSGLTIGAAGEMTDKEVEENVKAALDQYAQQTTKITERNPILEALNFTPDKIPSGEEISRALGIPKALGIPISTADKLLSGFMGFIGSTSGASQAILAEVVPLKPILLGKWSYDISKSGKEQAENFWQALKQGDMQGASDAGGTIVADALMLFGGKIPGRKRIPGLLESTARSIPPAIASIRQLLRRSTAQAPVAAALAGVRVPKESPESVAKDINVKYNPETQVGSVSTKNLKPEEVAALKAAGLPETMEFTPGKDSVIPYRTFYVPKDASRAEILDAYHTKLAQEFEASKRPEVKSEMDRVDTMREQEGVGAFAARPEIPPVPQGDRLVTVQAADGSKYVASFGDKYWDFGPAGKRASIAKVTSDGKWTHSATGKGETIIEDGGASAMSQGLSAREGFVFKGKAMGDADIRSNLNESHGITETSPVVLVDKGPMMNTIWEGRRNPDGTLAPSRPVRIEINRNAIYSKGQLDWFFKEELLHWYDIENKGKLDSIVSALTPAESKSLDTIIEKVKQYPKAEQPWEKRAQGANQLAAAWKNRPVFQRLVLEFKNFLSEKLGFRASEQVLRARAEKMAAQAILRAAERVRGIGAEAVPTRTGFRAVEGEEPPKPAEGAPIPAGKPIDPTALKHATDELERIHYGFEKRTPQDRQAMAEAWIRAGDTLASNPEAGRQLAQALADNPRRGLTGDESALILRHKRTLENSLNNAAEKSLTGTPEAKAEAQAEMGRYRDELNTLLNAVAERGSEWGREGRWRQALAYEDFTFATQERLLAAAKGRPLTDVEKLDLQRQLQEYKSKLEQLENFNSTKEQRQIEIETDSEIRKLEKTTPRKPKAKVSPEDTVAAISQKIANKVSRGEQSDITPLARKLTRAFLEQGVRGRENIIDSVHNVLKDIIPGISRSETMQAISGYGQYKLLPKDTISLIQRDYAGQMQQILKLEDMASGIAPKKTGLERRVPTAEERALIKQVEEAKRRGGYRVTDPETQLRTAMQAVKTRLQNQITDLERQIDTRTKIVKDKTKLVYDAEANKLKSRRDELKKQFDEIFPKQPMTEMERLRLWKDRTTKRIAELRDMIKSGDIAKKEPRPPVQLDIEGRRIKSQLEEIKVQLQHARDKAEWQKMSVFQKAKRSAIDAYDAARMLMTTGEFSFILRQGKWTALSHPIITARALPNMFRAMRNWRTAHEADLAILDHPDYPAAKKAKLHIVDESATLSRQEEIYAGRWAHALPVVSNFNRAARVFLNKIRFDTWMAMRKSMGRGGETTPIEDAAIARFVNESTGRGSLGSAEMAATTLGRVFFAPRYTISRFQLLLGHSLWSGSWRSRRVIATEYARALIGLGLYYTMLNMYFGMDKKKKPVQLDPRSADFGKVRIGETRIDPLAGLAQAATYSSRMASGETITQKGKLIPIRAKAGKPLQFGQADAADVTMRFLRSKLHPIPGTVMNLFSGTTMDGSETSISKETGNLVGPITYWDIYNAFKEQDVDDATALSLLGILGEGIQTYKHKVPKYPPTPQVEIRY